VDLFRGVLDPFPTWLLLYCALLPMKVVFCQQWTLSLARAEISWTVWCSWSLACCLVFSLKSYQSIVTGCLKKHLRY